MHRDPWPSDAAPAAALLAVIVCEIRQCDDAERDRLLTDFLRAAWPTPQAQRQ